MEQEQQNPLVQQAQQIAQLQEQLQQQNEQLLPLQQQVQEQHQQIQGLQHQVQQQQQQIQELQEQGDESDDDDNEEEDDDGPLVMNDDMEEACQGGDVESNNSLLDEGKSVNCLDSDGLTPIMLALKYCHIEAVIMLAGRGADLSRITNGGWNMLHFATLGGARDCVKWVLANTTININTTTSIGNTPIYLAANDSNIDAAKLLVEKGANLFLKTSYGRCAVDNALGPQVFQHAKDLIWTSVKPLLLLAKACSTNALPFNPSTAIPLSLITVFSISGLVREWIVPYVMRKDVIIRDPFIPRPPKQPDEVRLRLEAELAAAASSLGSSSSSSSSSNKRVREE
jgi:hypothetical protein